MRRMTLREAAQLTSRSMTTLRRYIRSGRLQAEKRYGRFGPEYLVSEESLADAGLDPASGDRPGATLPVRASSGSQPMPALPGGPAAAERVPMSLYQELQMKHEQLLVQYGMVRVSGLRIMELQAEVEQTRRRLGQRQQESGRTKQQLEQQTARLEQSLRQAQLEIEGRGLEIAALQEKVKALEMLTRNAVTNETIDRQFSAVARQARRVDELSTERSSSPRSDRLDWSPHKRPAEPDH